MPSSVERKIAEAGTSVLTMLLIGCTQAEPSRASIPPNTPTPESQQLPDTPIPTDTPTPPTETPQSIQPTPDQSSRIPPKPPTPTPTPIGQTEKIVEHLFPKDTTFFARFNNPNVTGALLVRVAPDGNIVYAHGVRRDCPPNNEDISYFATRMLPEDTRPVVIKFNRLKTNVGLEIQPDLQNLRGFVEFEALQLGTKACPGGKVNVEAQRRKPGLEVLGETWNEVLVAVKRTPLSSQAALDDLSGLCKACNIFSEGKSSSE